MAMPEHINTQCRTNGDCGGTCIHCNLFICSVCWGYEGGLPTECPGVVIPEKVDYELIYTGPWDFRGGRWTLCNPDEGPMGHNQTGEEKLKVKQAALGT